MESSRRQQAPSNTSSCGTPLTAESVTNLRIEVTFNLSGGIVVGKIPLKNRCLALLKTQVGLAYGGWNKVYIEKKRPMGYLFKEFKIPGDRKEEVIKEMGLQLKSWRKNLRSKYFEGRDINGIKALKDQVPEKEKIPLSQWNEFIKRKTTEDKMKQRQRGRTSRAKKTDIHCLGRQSYAEKAEEMMRKDRLQRVSERSDVFVEARKQRKTGEFHPSTAEEMLKSSQNSSSQTSLEGDALTMLYGKEGRWTTRSVGPVSKTKYKRIIPISLQLEKVVKKNVHVEQDICEIKQSLALLLKDYSEGQKCPPQQFVPQPTGLVSNLSNEVTRSHPRPTSSSSCAIFSLTNEKKIATGVIFFYGNS